MIKAIKNKKANYCVWLNNFQIFMKGSEFEFKNVTLELIRGKSKLILMP